jgi:integrase
MRPCDIDTTGCVWIYTPAGHKTAHFGHRRSVYLGPRAQEVIGPFLTRATDAWLFSPAEAEVERRAALSAGRKTPLSSGNRPGSNRRRTPRRQPKDHYTVSSYRRAIARACDQAFPPPEPLARRDGEKIEAWNGRLNDDQTQELAAWQREHRWHPHQLRHNAATELRREFGIETARIILGHRSAVVTEVYAELDRLKAVDAIQRVG